MHIVYLCSEYPPGRYGGIGVFTQGMARAMRARGHRVTVVGVYPTLERDNEAEDGGVRVLRLVPAGALRPLLNARRLRRALYQIAAEHPIDLIEGQENSLAFLGHLPAPSLIRMHGGHHFFYTMLGQRPRPARSLIERASFANADAFCAVSQFVADTTARLLPLRGRPIEILPNPVDTERFQPRRDVPEIDGLIVFIGTVTEKKGIRQLIAAMPQVVAAVPGARLAVIGRDSTDPATGGSYTRMLKRMIPPEMAERVEFHGAVDHVYLPEWIAQAQVCAFPSHMESQGLVILESMAMAKAVLTSTLGPCPELVEDGVSGLLCDPRQPEAIAARLIRLLMDAELRQRLGAAARARVLARFALNTLSARNEAFYARLVAM
jgi:glycosyltransferase involved in cell wall biosynthesis